MIEVAVHTHISAPREDIFDFLVDMAARLAIVDHFVDEYRLTHPAARGVGAAARFRLDAPAFTHYAETATVEVDPPRKIVEEGRAGRYNKIRTGTAWEITRQGSSLTRVDLVQWYDGGTPRDQFKMRLGGFRGWLRRRNKQTLERLRLIFEEPPKEPLARATIAGYEPEKAPRFGGSPVGAG
jgi:hypothetical protein